MAPRVVFRFPPLPIDPGCADPFAGGAAMNYAIVKKTARIPVFGPGENFVNRVPADASRDAADLFKAFAAIHLESAADMIFGHFLQFQAAIPLDIQTAARDAELRVPFKFPKDLFDVVRLEEQV